MGIAHCETKTLLPTQDATRAGASGTMRTSVSLTMRTRMVRSLTIELVTKKISRAKNEVNIERR